MKPPSLLRHIPLEIGHELCQLERRPYRHEHMKVVREHDTGVNLDTVEPLGSPEDAHNQLIELSAWPQKKAALNCTIGDLDEAATRWYEAKTSSHTNKRRNGRREPFKKVAGT